MAVGAADILKKQDFNFKWYFVGDGADRLRIERLIAENNLEKYVVITGLKENPYPFIKHCDIYVQPSYEESYGLTILEAQILGRIIISTKTVGGVDIIHDGIDGLLADIDAESIAKKIYSINQDSTLQETIYTNLAKMDCSKDYQRFKDDWKKLLEG